MTTYEYKVVPAPRRGLKAKGVKGSEARFANALQAIMNEHGAEGWEYQRTDTLPCEERQGLTGKTTSFQNMLVFRRALAEEAAQPDTPALIEDHSEVKEPQQPEKRVALTLTSPLLATESATEEAGSDSAAPKPPTEPRHAAE